MQERVIPEIQILISHYAGTLKRSFSKRYDLRMSNIVCYN